MAWSISPQRAIASEGNAAQRLGRIDQTGRRESRVGRGFPTDQRYGLLIRRSQVRALVGEPLYTGSIPETSVTVYSGDIGNTFAAKRLSMSVRRPVSWSKNPKS